jgi:hypothetical protein
VKSISELVGELKGDEGWWEEVVLGWLNWCSMS